MSTAFALLVLACTETAPPAAPLPPVDPPPENVPAPKSVLAPSPLELEAKVRSAGIADDLGTHVRPRPFEFEGKAPDAVALKTGVLLADTVFVGDKATKSEFLDSLRTLRAGMAALGTGAGLLSTIDGFVIQVENDTADRQDFLTELDGIASIAVPEDGWGPNDATGPLLQAGAWLEGTNLVAKAIVASGTGKGVEILRQKEAADFFLDYAQGEGARKAPDGLAARIADGLRRLSAIAARPTLTVEDAKEVVTITDDILSLV